MVGYPGTVAGGGRRMHMARQSRGYDPRWLWQARGIAASAGTLGNVGPGLGFAGPMGSYGPFSDFSKLVMAFLMWIGRLEILPVLVRLTRGYWRL